MAITVSLPASGPYSFDDLFGVIDFITTEGTVIPGASATSFSLSGSYGGALVTVTVNGTGFSYTQYQGIPYVNGGVVSTIDVSSGLGSFSFTNVNVDMATFSPIIISDLLESQPAAIETFLLLRDWDITLGNARDVAWSDTLVGDGVAFNPRGNDTIHAGGGNDRIFLGDGNDTAFGGRGKDKLAGGNGNDELRGEQGADILLGGAGFDILIGGIGDDRLSGGRGADKFVFFNRGGDDTITDFNTNLKGEKIDLSGVTRITGLFDLRNNHATQVGADVVIDDHAGTTITLLNTDLADLGRGDFIF
ncbi:calcium-binding protein [Seohaeicola zhoushanensis]|uniref:Calcium-binding protein n=1 Tax=Seohaeicola zhoushanensis TaxID=1569283 RepID=A0A8J3GXP4_9RHOB|nr:hypothetical protein [Seohaeicola zhoushanensis]GHF53261.1 hypothetical protein GCM10017056_26040 [Seohaeicola zhoushanensis]